MIFPLTELRLIHKSLWSSGCHSGVSGTMPSALLELSPLTLTGSPLRYVLFIFTITQMGQLGLSEVS